MTLNVILRESQQFYSPVTRKLAKGTRALKSQSLQVSSYKIKNPVIKFRKKSKIQPQIF